MTLLLPLATFAGVLLLVVGVYWMVVVQPEAQARRAVVRRLRPEAAARGTRLAVQSSARSGPGWFARQTHDVIVQSGMKLTLAGLLFTCALTGVVTGIVSFSLTEWVMPSVIAGLAALWVPYLFVRRRASQRMWEFEELFPEAIDLIARALRAGHAFSTGLAMVADEIPAPVGPEFKLIYDRQNYGMPLPDALRQFAQRVPLLDARFFVTAVLTQRESGGNLSGVLDNLASVIRERFKVRRQVRVVSAHGRITAAVLAALPPAVAGLQAFVAPVNLKILLADPLGQKMLMGAGVLQVVGALAIRKLVKVEY